MLIQPKPIHYLDVILSHPGDVDIKANFQAPISYILR